MKKSLLLFASLLSLTTPPVFAQHPLVGTWKMVSEKFTKHDGTRHAIDSIEDKVLWIISPTHCLKFAQYVKGGSLIFSNVLSGPVRVEGNKLIIEPTVSSFENYEKTKIAYTWKKEADQLILSGSTTFANGKKNVVDESVWQRVKEASSNSSFLGTWNQLSSSYTMADGTKGSHTNATATRWVLITPTYYARIDHKDHRFEGAFIATYSMEGDKMYIHDKYDSDPINKDIQYVLVQKVVEDKMYSSGFIAGTDGKKYITWEDVFQRVDSKKPKVARK